MLEQIEELPDPLASIGKDMAVAIYPTHQSAETAFKELETAGFDLKKLSLVGRDHHTDENPVGYYNKNGRMLVWGKFGPSWGGIWERCSGAAFFLIPGIGAVLLAGPIVSAMVSVLENAVALDGLSALGAALVGLGIPHDNAQVIETEITAGKYLLCVHGTQDEIANAQGILDLSANQGSTEDMIHTVVPPI